MSKRKYCEGMSKFNSQGIKMTIIKYNSNKDIIVEFDDEWHTQVKTGCDSFKSGQVRNPHYKKAYKTMKDKREGLISTNKYGEEMKIVEYKSAKELTVEFLHNGEKVNCTWKQWKDKVVKSSEAIRHPINFVDLTGQVFNNLKVIEWDTNPPDYIKEKIDQETGRWKCQCLACGNYTWAKSYALTSGLKKWCELCGAKHKIPPRKGNIYDLSGEYGIGYTINSNKPFYFDLEDYDLIKQFTWSEHNGYAKTTYDNNKNLLMHRLVMNIADPKIEIDHIGHNTLDNRKSKLRICEGGENHRNTTLASNNKSGITGVYKEGNKWRAFIWHNKTIHLGTYSDINDAIKARKEAENKYFKEFSYDNSMKIYEEDN